MRDGHDRLFASLARVLDGWFVGLAARMLFAAIFLTYYLNSALTKLGDGLFGIFAPSVGAFAQILPPVAEQYGYDSSAIPFFPWHVIVILGTLAEIALPLLIVAGLITRLAALGMIGFIIVQTFVDVNFHGGALGSLFDNQASDLIDQRILWIFPLLVLVIKGAGTMSLDAVTGRVLGQR